MSKYAVLWFYLVYIGGTLSAVYRQVFLSAIFSCIFVFLIRYEAERARMNRE